MVIQSLKATMTTPMLPSDAQLANIANLFPTIHYSDGVMVPWTPAEIRRGIEASAFLDKVRDSGVAGMLREIEYFHGLFMQFKLMDEAVSTREISARFDTLQKKYPALRIDIHTRAGVTQWWSKLGEEERDKVRAYAIEHQISTIRGLRKQYTNADYEAGRKAALAEAQARADVQDVEPKPHDPDPLPKPPRAKAEASIADPKLTIDFAEFVTGNTRRVPGVPDRVVHRALKLLKADHKDNDIWALAGSLFLFLAANPQVLLDHADALGEEGADSLDKVIDKLGGA